MKARLIKDLEHRGTDDWGCGDFGASRGSRTHKGIDYCADVGDEICSPATGSVTKLGYPYAPKPGDKTTFRYVEVTDYQGFRHRVFYIDPIVQMDRHLKEGDIIGIQQDIAGKYSSAEKGQMRNHCHYEILDLEGNPVDPEA